MAWTTPATISVGDTATAAWANTTVRDNLLYLHGDAGAIALIAPLSITGNITSTANLRAQSAASGLWLDETSAKGAYLVLNSSQLQVQRRATNFGAFEASPFAMNIGAPSSSLFMDANGLIGMGTASPAGKLHVVGAGSIAGAGHAIGSVAAVTTVQTVFAAGTVARAMTAIVFDRDNGTGTPLTVSLIQGVALSGNVPYTCIAPSGDLMTIAVTAGGAVTAVRTTGTHGSHDIVIFLITT